MFEYLTVNNTALCKWCAKIAGCSPQLILTSLYAGSSIQNAIQQFVCCIHLPFVTNQTSSYVQMNIFLIMTDTVTAAVSTLPSDLLPTEL
jgi:hypothetical protein